MEPLETPKTRTRTRKAAKQLEDATEETDFLVDETEDTEPTVDEVLTSNQVENLAEPEAEATVQASVVQVDTSSLTDSLPTSEPAAYSSVHPVNLLKKALKIIRTSTLPKSFTASIQKQLFFFDPPQNVLGAPVLSPGSAYTAPAPGYRSYGHSRASFMQTALSAYGAGISLSYEGIPSSLIDIYAYTIVHGFKESSVLRDMVSTLASRLLQYQKQDYSSGFPQLAEVIELVDLYLKAE
jgi:hypothetical protein